MPLNKMVKEQRYCASHKLLMASLCVWRLLCKIGLKAVHKDELVWDAFCGATVAGHLYPPICPQVNCRRPLVYYIIIIHVH